MIKTSLIILTRNEISGVTALLSKIPFKSVDEYFAVDYRSTDGTVEYFRKHNIPVVKQEIPGRAAAFELGYKKSKGTYLIFFSPDGNEDPADIPKLVKLLDQGADMAIASRFIKGSHNEEDEQTLRPRAWANMAFTQVANVLWNRGGRYIADTINGYRAMRRDIFEKIRPDATGYAIEYQMTIRAMKLGLNITEIPTYEGARIGGESGAKAIPTGLRFLYFLGREIRIGKNF